MFVSFILGTICVRTIMLPFVIIAQKNTIKFTNHMPKITELQMKMTDARQSGDYIESMLVFFAFSKHVPYISPSVFRKPNSLG